MRRPYEIRQRKEGIVCLEGFSRFPIPPYVCSVSEIRIGHKVFVHRLLVNEFSAGDVYEDTVLLHLRQPLRVDDPCRLTCQGKSEDYCVGSLQKIGQSARSREELDLLYCGLFPGKCVHLHAKPLSDSPNNTPDSAKSEHAQDFLPQHGDLTPFVESTSEDPLLFSKLHVEFYY